MPRSLRHKPPNLTSPHPARGVAGEKTDMTMTRILNGLEDSDTHGAEARAMARLGFLEWAFAAEGQVTPQVARDALAHPAAQRAESDAAQAFVGYLREATRAFPAAHGRRGRTRAIH